VVYLDSSALIKNYLTEPGTPKLQAFLREQTQAGARLFSSVLTFAEMHAIVARKLRDNTIPKTTAVKIHDEFDDDWLFTFSGVEVNSAVLGFVRGLVDASLLRGADTLHLASALWVRDMARMGVKSGSYSGELTFVSSDRQLLLAAKKQGIVTFDPTTI
jgi:predicted nucleic acid-binding protein